MGTYLSKLVPHKYSLTRVGQVIGYPCPPEKATGSMGVHPRHDLQLQQTKRGLACLGLSRPRSLMSGLKKPAGATQSGVFWVYKPQYGTVDL
jgi:hypothetical protein